MDYEKLGLFYLGKQIDPATRARTEVPVLYDAADLVTHAVIVGMTGSGKTGLCVALLEEALRSRVPVILLDIKGDLANLMLTFPGLTAAEFAPWAPAEGDASAAACREWMRSAQPGDRFGDPVS